MAKKGNQKKGNSKSKGLSKKVETLNTDMLFCPTDIRDVVTDEEAKQILIENGFLSEAENFEAGDIEVLRKIALTKLITKFEIDNQLNDMNEVTMKYVARTVIPGELMGHPGKVVKKYIFKASEFKPYYAKENPRGKQVFNATAKSFLTTLVMKPELIYRSSSSGLVTCGHMKDKPNKTDINGVTSGKVTLYNDVQLLDMATRALLIAHCKLEKFAGQFDEYLEKALIEVEIIELEEGTETSTATKEDLIEIMLNKNISKEVSNWDSIMASGMLNCLIEGENAPLAKIAGEFVMKEAAKTGENTLISDEIIVQRHLDSSIYMNNLEGKTSFTSFAKTNSGKLAGARRNCFRKADLEEMCQEFKQGRFSPEKHFKGMFVLGIENHKIIKFLEEEYLNVVLKYYHTAGKGTGADSDSIKEIMTSKNVSLILNSSSALIEPEWASNEEVVDFADYEIKKHYNWNECQKYSLLEGIRCLQRYNNGKYFYACDVIELISEPEFISAWIDQISENNAKEFERAEGKVSSLELRRDEYVVEIVKCVHNYWKNNKR